MSSGLPGDLEPRAKPVPDAATQEAVIADPLDGPKRLRRDPVAAPAPPWLVPVYKVERGLEALVAFGRRLALVDLLQLLSSLALLASGWVYLTGGESRRQARISSAWQVLNTAQGKPGSGGREGALHTLVAEGASLARIDLSNAVLPGLKVRGVVMRGATLRLADLVGSDFRCADTTRTLSGCSDLSD